MAIEYQGRSSTSAAAHLGDLLLVNDSMTYLMAMSTVLSHKGYRVSTAKDAESALQIINTKIPDLVISDVVMPGMTGIEFCRRLKTGAVTADIPVILVSGSKNDYASVLEGHDAGADDYLEVDAPSRLLIKKVERLIYQARANRARLKAEIALWESEKRYRLLFESNPHPMWVYDLETLRFLTVNEKAVSHYGYSREEFLSLTLEDMRPREDIPQLIADLSAMGKGLQFTGVRRHKRKDGSVIDVEIHSTEILFDGRPARLVMANDVTERIRSQQAVRASEERFSKAFMESPVPMSIVTYKEGKYVDVNESYLRNTGYGREELIGRSTADVKLYADPGERARLRRMLEAEGRIRSAEVRRRIKSGEVRTVLASSEIIYIESEKCILTTSIDITDRKRLEEQLLQSRKMETVGRLAGGIAHDFNNLLTAILGFGQLLLQRVGNDEGSRKEAEEVIKAGERAAALTSQLLAFSRRQSIEAKVLDLNEVVLDLEKLLRRLIGDDVELRAVLEPDLGRVRADPGQIEQVVMNLVVNARDAMPDGGKLLIETRNVALGEEYASGHFDVSPGPYVMLAVSDTGVGMSAETRARIFDPFFTTKEQGKGTGLGLSIVYGIVKQSGGHIWVYSEPGHGTTFRIYLPLEQEEALGVSRQQNLGPLPRGSETLLLVEDEPAVRIFAAHVLREQGYTVLEAANGQEALAMAQERAGSGLHLLITDVVMPLLGGKLLASQLKEIRPEIKILFTSGYTDDTFLNHTALSPGINFLQKPFTIQTLARKVREVLESAQ